MSHIAVIDTSWGRHLRLSIGFRNSPYVSHHFEFTTKTSTSIRDSKRSILAGCILLEP